MTEPPEGLTRDQAEAILSQLGNFLPVRGGRASRGGKAGGG
jgi:hypothetical protein